MELLLFICQTFWIRHLIFFPFHLTVLLPLWWNFFLYSVLPLKPLGFHYIIIFAVSQNIFFSNFSIFVASTWLFHRCIVCLSEMNHYRGVRFFFNLPTVSVFSKSDFFLFVCLYPFHVRILGWPFFSFQHFEMLLHCVLAPWFLTRRSAVSYVPLSPVCSVLFY